jgi:VWFA-related protein
VAFSAYVLLTPAQTLSPGEVRLSSRPYEPRPILRSVSRLVQLEVVVRDSRGRPIAGLTKDDFSVYDSGKNRELTAFSVELSNEAVHTSPLSGNSPPHTPPDLAQPPDTPQPKSLAQSTTPVRWIAIHFDDINTPAGDLAHAKIASKRFVSEAAATGDRIGVFTTSAGRTIDFTSDTSAVLAGIATVQSHPRMPPGGLSSCPRMAPYDAYQIVNNDPTAMKAKILEACQCGGSDPTNGLCMSAEAIQPSELLNPTLGQGGGADIIESVKAQAQQTWNLAHQLSQMTLEAIRNDLDLLGGKSGSRMLLLASSGFLSGMLEEQQDAIVNEAVRAGVVINALDSKGLYAEAPGGPIDEANELVNIPTSSTVFQVESLADRLDDLDSSMARFAESTGGLLFRNNNDLNLGFRQLGLLPACTYLLGFTPAEDGKYHKIKVELKNKNHQFVQVRPGYFAPITAAVDQTTPTEKLDTLMSSTDENTNLAAAVSEKLGTATSGGRQLTIQAHIDIEKLAFEQQKDRHVQKLTFIAALFDPRGNFVIGKQADMELALKPDNFDRFSKTGINGVMQLEVPPGTYRLRVVVQESFHGSFSATTKNLQIP